MKNQPNSQAYSGVDPNAHLSDGRGGAGGYDIKKPYGGVDPKSTSHNSGNKSGGMKKARADKSAKY